MPPDNLFPNQYFVEGQFFLLGICFWGGELGGAVEGTEKAFTRYGVRIAILRFQNLGGLVSFEHGCHRGGSYSQMLTGRMGYVSCDGITRHAFRSDRLD